MMKIESAKMTFPLDAMAYVRICLLFDFGGEFTVEILQTSQQLNFLFFENH